jgi:Zn-dependent metalloprotease
MRRRRALCSILPPYILRNIATRGDVDDRAMALASMQLSITPRDERQAVAVLAIAGELILPPRRKRRTVFDARMTEDLPGLNVRSEGQRATRDLVVNEAYEAAGKTYDYFRRVHGRSSVDDRGMRLDSTVHFGEAFSNAHWNGRQMIYGDGDGKYFGRFTSAIDVVAHELTHGVTQHAAGFAFSGQGGALAEHYSDVFGLMVKQYEAGKSEDWIVGRGLFTDRVHGEGIRSFQAPGTAFHDPVLGRDLQPAHMRDYVKTSSDHGGVHINSGIPNHAFYRAAALLGGKAWEHVGRIWYRALINELGPRSRFQHCADATWRAAGELFGSGSAPQDAVRAGWAAVGVDVSERALAGEPKPATTKPRAERPRDLFDAFVPPDAAAELPNFA